MIARLVPLEALRGERYFRWRGGDVSRIEGLTDGVFALAMTLLILSTEVPRNWEELQELLRGIPAFAACFALFVLLWYYHFQFHRRFGLENLYTVFLNVCLLFLILVYVYPAKFLFSALANHFLYHRRDSFPVDEGGGLMLFYSGGVVGIFLLFTLMYLHAYQHREVLGLNDVEVHMTRTTIREHLIHAAVGLASILLVLLGRPGASGLIYLLVGPLQGLNGWLSGRAVRAGTVRPRT
jgi:uncharacterized membrane protein